MMFYKYIHSSYEKLREGEELTKDEVEELLNLIEKAMGKWIPTPEELNEYNLDAKDVQEFNKKQSTVNLVPELVAKMTEYNEKYHEWYEED